MIAVLLFAFVVGRRLPAQPPTVTAPASQQAGTSAGNSETDYPSGGDTVKAYVVRPSGGGKHPAVILVHDTQGLDDGVRDLARRFAGAGFVAFAPDLLSRSGGTSSQPPNTVAAALMKLPLDTPVEDLKAAYAFLQKDPDVDASKISAVGLGWGGWRTYKMSEDVPTLFRLVTFYGATPNDENVNEIEAPILANYAQYDHHITGIAPWMEREREKAGKQYTYFVYPHTSRGFFNSSLPEAYNADAAKVAWERTLKFLGSGSVSSVR